MLKVDRVMFDAGYPGLRLPLDAMKGREDLCGDRNLSSDQGTYNHHSIDDILGYRRMQESMKGTCLECRYWGHIHLERFLDVRLRINNIL